MGTRGPLVTLGAVGALGVALWFGNVFAQPAPPTPTPKAVVAPSVPVQTTVTPPPARGFPAKADYAGTVPTETGEMRLELTIDGDKATAYACDDHAVELWLRGDASNGEVHLTGQDMSSVLDGYLEDDAVAGLMTIGDRSWVFTLPAVDATAGQPVSITDGSDVIDGR